GGTPSLGCANPSEVPDCACSCTNGVTFNQPLSPSSSGPMIPNNWQADKEACLLREQEAIANLN
ncbi:hypothetical protein COCVIDRAFT_47475, partial [Bipolaris victoriae FI3]